MTNTFFNTNMSDTHTAGASCASASFCAKNNNANLLHITDVVCFFVVLFALANGIVNVVIISLALLCLIILSIIIRKVFSPHKVRDCIVI